ncbi:MAG TPA: DUF4399 domain-containing protein [Rhodocyclaceae bacterium]|nr:DUF4399 domain-containing protein [Rhodocyclaceae bacterium]
MASTTIRTLRSVIVLASMVAMLSAAPLAGARTPAPEGAEVYFIAPTDGATLKSPVTVHFGMRGMGVAPAGVEMPKTGHHHLILNAPLPPMDQGIPADERHIHFGGGQTEVRLELPPGKHEMQLLVGDHLHIPHEPPIMSDRITITVE